MSDRMADTFELVKKSQKGDAPALDELFGRYYPRVLKVVRLRMGDKLRRRADSFDVLQETFATAVRIFDRFEMRNEASMINWLAKLAERSITDMAEKESAQKRNSDREVPIYRPTSGSSTAGVGFEVEAEFAVPLDRMIRDEERELLDSCIQELEVKYREIIILRNYLGLSFVELAEECGRPSEGAARMMHAKAMRDLTRLVEKKTAG